jgi:AcrR family transcriptional regulator
MEKRRSRGRPRQFETPEALASVLETFRARGFSGTSFEDLTGATGLNRPSLYAAFGNKQALFEAAIDLHWSRLGKHSIPALRSGRTLRSDLHGFFSAILDEIYRGEVGGCIIACALPGEVERNPALRPRLATLLELSDQAVAARLVVARQAGELPKNADPAALAGVLVGMTLSVSLRARSGALRSETEKLVAQAIDLVCEFPGPAARTGPAKSKSAQVKTRSAPRSKKSATAKAKSVPAKDKSAPSKPR